MGTYLKSFQYTNSMGAHKELVVFEKVEGRYSVLLWNLDNGELCGHAHLATQELNDYLKHFDIEERFE